MSVTYPLPAAEWRASKAPVRARLSRDDIRLLAIIATGVPITSVAERAGISDRTVRRRVRYICDVIGVTTSIQAVAWAARMQLI
jgi:DNA-binding NarL/FixJ family response regulator